MALDTPAKRRGAVLGPVLRILPAPDGSVSLADRVQEAGEYRGVSTPGLSGQIPALIARMRQFFNESPAFLAWIHTYDPSEVAANHAYLGISPRDQKARLPKGPVAFISGSSRRVDNAGEYNSFNGWIEVRVRIFWKIPDDVLHDHMQEYQYLDAIEKELLGLRPFEEVYGGAVMSMEGSLVEYAFEVDDYFVSDNVVHIDYGPGGP